MSSLNRAERLQIMLSPEEIRALDDWRFAYRMPSRAAAIRELLKRGLAAEGVELATDGKTSTSFGVLDEAPTRKSNGAKKARAGRQRRLVAAVG